MSVYYVSNICPKDYICVDVHTHTHTPQITKKSHESNILLQPFILDIAKLHNFFLIGMHKKKNKKKEHISISYILCGEEFQAFCHWL